MQVDVLDPKIIVAQNDPVDVESIRCAIDEISFPCRAEAVHCGELLLKQLQDTQPTSLPDLILLDTVLGKTTGIEVLKALKKDPKLDLIPVFLLSTSDSAVTINEAYRQHANMVFIKPSGVSQYTYLMSAIRQLWFTMVAPPCYL